MNIQDPVRHVLVADRTSEGRVEDLTIPFDKGSCE